jgi:4-amino-4-deoxy-L-arabinose transferase-like glycosyltransferase
MKKEQPAPAEAAPFDASKWMVAILAVYALVAMAYISVTPYRTEGCLLSRMQDVVQQDIGAPDERQHTNYIRHLINEKSFPVFDPKSPDLYESYQSHQRPLEFLVSAPAAAIAGENEQTEMWALRLVNVLLGGLAVWGIFVGLRRLTGKPDIGVTAAAICAFLPMFLALSSAVSNDMALFLIGVWLMNLVAIGWEKGWTIKHCALLGLCVGLGLLTKTTAVVFIPIAIYGLLAKKESRPNLSALATLFGIALIVALPWLIRNQALYGDPLAIRAFQEASVGNLAADTAIERAGGVASYWFEFVIPVGLQGFWGVFGYFDIFMTSTIYLTANVIALALLGSFGWSFVQSSAAQKRTSVLLLSMLLMVGAAFVSYNLNYFQAQGRYLYPAIFAIAGIFAIGLQRFAGTEKRTLGATVAIATLLLCVNAYLTFYLLPVAFEEMQRCVRTSPY